MSVASLEELVVDGSAGEVAGGGLVPGVVVVTPIGVRRGVNLPGMSGDLLVWLP